MRDICSPPFPDSVSRKQDVIFPRGIRFGQVKDQRCVGWLYKSRMSLSYLTFNLNMARPCRHAYASLAGQAFVPAPC